MQTIIYQKEKTCRELFTEFKFKFTVVEVESHPQIARLFTYLQHRCSMANGNYVHEPSQEIKDLLGKFLSYNPEKNKPTPEEVSHVPFSNNAVANVASI